MTRKCYIVALYWNAQLDGDLDPTAWSPVVVAETDDLRRECEFYELVSAWTTFEVTEFRRLGKDFWQNSSQRFVVVHAPSKDEALKAALTKV